MRRAKVQAGQLQNLFKSKTMADRAGEVLGLEFTHTQNRSDKTNLKEFWTSSPRAEAACGAPADTSKAQSTAILIKEVLR